MNKILTVLMTVASITAYSGSEEVVEGMKKKAIRGAVDLVTGIVELPMQICKGYNNGFGPIENEAGSKTVGTILGIFRGFGHTGGRFVSGGKELFGFWTANPADSYNVGVPFDAQYSWEEGSQYSYFDPSFSEGILPVGRKLAHGLSDAWVGIAELPGQIMKGNSDGDIVLGIGKGIWYTLSRQVNGFTGVLGCLVPNHPDELGRPYGGDWPWSDLMDELE